MLIPAASCRFCVLDKRNMKAVAIWNWSFAFGIGVWGCISIMFGSLFLFVSFFFLPAQLSTTSENISLMLGFHCFKNMFKLCIAKATVIAIAQVMKILNPVHCFHNIRFLNICVILQNMVPYLMTPSEHCSYVLRIKLAPSMPSLIQIFFQALEKWPYRQYQCHYLCYDQTQRSIRSYFLFLVTWPAVIAF